MKFNKLLGAALLASSMLVAGAAHAKTLVIFHHDPDHDDAFMDRVASDADMARPGTLVAREGLVLHP